MEEEQRKMITEVNGGEHCEWNDSELEVAEFMPTLGEFIPEVEKRLREKVRVPFTVRWGEVVVFRCRSRRKTPVEGTKTTAMVTEAATTPSQREVNSTATAIASPSTPLCLTASSESEDNSASVSQQHKRKRDELTQTVEEQSELQKRLRKAVSVDEQGEKSNFDARNIINLGARSSSQLSQTAAIRPPLPPRPPPPHLSQLMLNPNPMTRSEETHQRPSEPTPNLKLQYQSPNPVMYSYVGPSSVSANHAGPIWNNNGAPKQEATVGLIQRNASQEYVRAILHGQARVKAAEARKFRRKVINRRRLQKLHSKSSSGSV